MENPYAKYSRMTDEELEAALHPRPIKFTPPTDPIDALISKEKIRLPKPQDFWASMRFYEGWWPESGYSLFVAFLILVYLGFLATFLWSEWKVCAFWI
jgi:hypothetical protein